MKNVLIVHAHHEPKSFCSALKDRAVEVFRAQGANVVTSDLYAQRFNPVSDRRNFVSIADSNYLKQQVEEAYASDHDGFAPEIETEIRKLEACDFLLFSFPLWWFGLPGILKGWVDRVLTYKRVYGVGKWYDRGSGVGKKAMAVLTTGGPATAYSGLGIQPAMGVVLQPIQHGIFWFNGFTPLEAFVSWGPAHLEEEERRKELERFTAAISDVDQRPELPHLGLNNFDSETFLDRSKRFMAVWRLASKLPEDAGELVSRERARLQEMFLRGEVLQHWTASSRERGYIILRAEDDVYAAKMLEQLPLRRFLDFEISEVTQAV
jgi:NAD(P)H dehydrogenase (quinone)